MMSAVELRRRRPLLLWPLILLWRLVTALEKMIGIALLLLIGLVLMVAGLALCATFVGAILGIPLFLLGFLLVLRGLY
ncbi:MAG: hypothetical protein HYV26_16425 [Candidatus Hydrogenedentes bacterium]|nr:hypothetical protein [Candidatus Hydrogenedentota bacterium]MBI3117215.1 hypothetical protein [Candidatus Hydrogenedentota bacterium]